MNIQLDRPIVFFDIESTGLHVMHDRIVEISVVKRYPDGSEESKKRLINPGTPIPAESTAIHGITDEQVKDAPEFRQVAKSFFDFLEGCDLAGFNITKFDIPLLTAEFQRCGLTFSEGGRRIVDVQRIFHQNEPRTLAAALKYYCNEEHTDAHGAEQDARASMRVLDAQLERYPHVPRESAALHEYCNPMNPGFVDREGKLRWRNGEVIIGFGQKFGTTLRHLVSRDADYLKWILRGDFNSHVKEVVEDALRGKYPEKLDKIDKTGLQTNDEELIE